MESLTLDTDTEVLNIMGTDLILWNEGILLENREGAKDLSSILLLRRKDFIYNKMEYC